VPTSDIDNFIGSVPCPSLKARLQPAILSNPPLRSFNHLIGTDEQIGRHSDPKHLRGLKIDDQLDLRGLARR
jgi:hypothetical protein